jgi:hypothetical protein
MSWLRRNAFLVAFVAVNLLIAAKPAGAALRNAACNDPDGGQYACCKTCIVLCGCDIITEE